MKCLLLHATDVVDSTKSPAQLRCVHEKDTFILAYISTAAT